jgi:hypothetical protein
LMLSAYEDPARDEVLTRIVDVITSFGRSGLIDGSEDSTAPMRHVYEHFTKYQPGSGGEG